MLDVHSRILLWFPIQSGFSVENCNQTSNQLYSFIHACNHLHIQFFFLNVPNMGHKASPQKGFHDNLCDTPPPSSLFPGGLLMPFLPPSLLSTCMSGQRGPTSVKHNSFPHEINYHILDAKWKCLLKVQKYSFLIGGRLWKWWEGSPEKCGGACNILIFFNLLTPSAVHRRDMRAAFKLPCIAAIDRLLICLSDPYVVISWCVSGIVN